MVRNAVQELVDPDARRKSASGDGEATQDAASSAAFDELFLSHYIVIVRLLARMLGDYGQAEDLANEAFLKLYRRPDLQRSHGNLGGWLYRAAMNLGIDALRAATRRIRYETAASRSEVRPQSDADALDQMLKAEKQQRVRAVLAALKPAHAQALFLRVCGYSYKELADSLAIERGAVGTLLIRAEAEFEKRYLERFGRQENL